MDHEYEGEWSWRMEPSEARIFLEALQDVSEKTWGEIQEMRTNSKRKTRALHHYQTVESICSDAQKRLAFLNLDLEEVFRLRRGSLGRIWGYVLGGVFHIIWFDAKHRVCPSEAD